MRGHAAACPYIGKSGAQPQDNFLSKKLNADADKLVAELSQLNGRAFDARYAENELGYHKAVNGLVEKTFIPNIDNAQVKSLFKQALVIFKAHQIHAEKMVKTVMVSQAMTK